MNKKSRIFLAIFVILILTFAIYMGLKYKATIEEGELLEQRLEDKFSAISSGDVEQLGVNMNLKDNRIFRSILGSINISVIENKTTSKTCDIKVNILTKDFKDLFTKIVKKTIEIDQINSTKSEKEKLSPEEAELKLAEYVDELIVGDEVKTISNQYVFHHVKENGEWKLTNPKEEIVSIILNGIEDKDTFIEELQNELIKEMK